MAVGGHSAPFDQGVGVGGAMQGLAGPGGFVEPNYEVFDPLNWLLDGLVEFPQSFTMGMDSSQGIA